MIKVMTVFGTRPEAIKVAPVIKALEKDSNIESLVCVTAQHREMLDQVLKVFDIKPDYDLDIMKHGQSLSDITSKVLYGIEEVIRKEEPDIVLVHGDTTTSFAAGLACFYNGVKVGHIEAGLRSKDKYSPYPEEMNRMLTGKLADIHFSPTITNVENLIKENIKEDTIYRTGNTVIDALNMVIDKKYKFEDEKLNDVLSSDRINILMTAHRRENQGQTMHDIFSAVNEVSIKEDVNVIFPIHLNPKVREVADVCFKDNNNIILTEPLDYEPFMNLMDRVDIVLTDSGGLQEEAPSLGKPVLVIRRETERPEAVEAGTVKLVGVEKSTIKQELEYLINDKDEYNRMSNAVNPYGDGHASERIVEAIKEYFNYCR